MKKLLSTLLLLLLVPGVIAAQSAGDQTSQTGNDITTTPERIAVRVDLVNVLFTATDKKNRLVLNLTKDDFRVFEDKKPQKALLRDSYTRV